MGHRKKKEKLETTARLLVAGSLYQQIRIEDWNRYTYRPLILDMSDETCASTPSLPKVGFFKRVFNNLKKSYQGFILKKKLERQKINSEIRGKYRKNLKDLVDENIRLKYENEKLKNGKSVNFEENDINKYSIGDTIK